MYICKIMKSKLNKTVQNYYDNIIKAISRYLQAKEQ